MPGDGRIHTLIIHEILPHPDQNGCDLRLMQVLNELLAQGHELTYVARNGVGREQYLLPLEQLGIKVYVHDFERLRRFGVDGAPAWTFGEVVKEGRFDLAIVYLWFWTALSAPEDYLNEIRRLSPQTRVAVLTDDQHGLRERRLAELSGLWSDLERARDFEQRELEVYRRADMVLAISDWVRQGLQAAVPDLEIEILPNMAESAPPGPEFAPRANVLFLGNFENATSLEGLKWLLEEVWPRVAACLPGVELHLAGHRLPEGLAGDRIVPLGFVEDLNALFAQHRVFVAPVRFCGGIQTKVLVALARSLPVVTTPASAEGLNLRHENEVLVAATPQDFAVQVKRAYCDEPLWRKLSQNGADFVKSQFSRERLAAQVRLVTNRLRQHQPKSYDVRHVWSALRIEKEFPDVLTRPVRERIPARLHAYCALAEYFLAEGDVVAALEQLRHVFSFVRGQIPHSGFFVRFRLGLDRCYREMRTPEIPADLASEAKECLRQVSVSTQSLRMGAGDTTRLLVKKGAGRGSIAGSGSGMAGGRADSLPPPTRRAKLDRARPNISVIVPTYNRCAVLASCLDALEQQSLAKDRFEVIVIDDGSTDATARFCQGLSMSFPLIYLRQTNAGAGAARRLGSEIAEGKYLLLFNDDTVATPGLLAEHLRVQREHAQDNCAVLGDFRYPVEARKRALPSYFATRPFLFPQITMKAGFHDSPSNFISCNLSIRREVALRAGSFDPQFRVAEDTELGARLAQQGYRILYHPKAVAWHDHVIFTSADLIKHARVYAPADLLLYRKHTGLLGSGTGPFGRLDEDWAARTKDFLAQSRGQIAEWIQAIGRFDKLDFAPLFFLTRREVTEAELVLRAFDQIVPRVHWFHRFERLLELRQEEGRTTALGRQFSAISSPPPALT